MDMHKDFIHIDDVFKRAADGEEQERSGAWLRMKETLDKEMPVGMPISSRGGRFRRLLPLLLILLLGGGAASYYAVNRSTNYSLNSTNDQETINGLAGTGSASPGGQASPEVNMGPASTEISGSAANSVPDEQASALSKAEVGTQSQGVTAVQAPVYLASNNPNNPLPERHVLTPMVRQHIDATAPAGASTMEEAASIIERKTVVEQLHPKKKEVLASGVPPVSPMKSTPAIVGKLPVVRSEEGTFYKEERDTFTEVSVVRQLLPMTGGVHQNKVIPKVKIDTLAVKRVERLRYIPLNRMEMISLAEIYPDLAKKVKVVPIERIYSGNTKTSEEVAMVPLANYMVHGKKVDKKSLNNLLQQTGNSIASYFDGSHKFYVGALVGGNMSVGNPLGMGMQFGLAGLYSIRERLVLSVEARVMNHNFGNYSIADTRTTYDLTSSQLAGGAWLFSGKEYKVTSTYRLRQYTQIELPVMINYALGRMAIYGGPSFYYAFPLQWEHSQSFTESAIEEQRLSPVSPFENSGFSINQESDFNKRMGLGFVSGVTYDFSRTLSLDVRLSKTLWTNGSTPHVGINRLYNSPKLQLSLGYYFGRRDKVVYMMQR